MVLAASPYYTKHVIPAGTYNGQDEDVTTVAVGAVILARDDVSEDAIYALTVAARARWQTARVPCQI